MMPISIHLRLATVNDLPTLFEHQAHPQAVHMAAFVGAAPYDPVAYRQKWTRLLQDPSIHLQVILEQGVIVGSVAKYERERSAELTYSIAPAHWGKGLASQAVQQFLGLEAARPLWARVAFDNLGSQRVLEKNGFARVRTEQGYAAGRDAVIEEFVYVLQ